MPNRKSKEFPHSFKTFIVIAFIFSLANFSYMFFIIKVQDLFGKQFSVIDSLILYIIFNIFYAGLSLPSGILSDKIGRKNILIAGYLLFPLFVLVLPLLTHQWEGLFFLLYMELCLPL